MVSVTFAGRVFHAIVGILVLLCHFMGNKIRFFSIAIYPKENINLEVIITVLNFSVILQLIKNHKTIKKKCYVHFMLKYQNTGEKMGKKFLKSSDIYVLKSCSLSSKCALLPLQNNLFFYDSVTTFS